MLVVLLVVVQVMLGSSEKFKTARNIKLQGAVAGNANFDGSKDIIINVTQNNIVAVTGNFTIEASAAKKVKTLNYPSGFNSSNCTVLSFGTYCNKSMGYSFGHHSNDSAGLIRGTNDKDISLNSNGIDLYYKNISTDPITVYYQIVLLKIS